MKVVTANRLADGTVVFLGAGGALVRRFDHASLFDESDAEHALKGLRAQNTLIAAAYLIDADGNGPIGREALRERIRKNGPTVRRDLGRQSEDVDERL